MVRVDFISDITCPWCAIGLRTLQQAIANVADRLPVTLHLQPFELNPGLPPDGEPIADYARRKYGVDGAQLEARQTLIRQRAAVAGLTFPPRTHVYNTFDAHRLLHWAEQQGRGLELKHALLRAYHERGRNPASAEVLVDAACEAGLEPSAAGDVLAGGAFADEVRATVRRWQHLGIEGVPATVIDGRHLIQGAQPVGVYEEALRRAAA